MYGFTEPEALGMNIFSIVPDGKKPEALAFVEAIKEGKELSSFETQRITKDGRILDVWLTVTKLVDDNGKIRAIATTERDVTEKKKAEKEREDMIAALKKALAEVRTLRGLLPICAACKKVRDSEGYWKQIETYIKEHSDADFSHGICPDCAKKLYPEVFGDLRT